MIEIHINKDVGSYEAKFVGPFTMRQTVCIAVAAPICWFAYKTLTPIVSADVAGFFMAVPAVIAWLFGWCKPYGMRTERFIQSVFINMVLAPANRKYKTKELYVTEATSAVEQDNKGTNQSKKRKTRRPRYKVSPDAVK